MATLQAPTTWAHVRTIVEALQLERLAEHVRKAQELSAAMHAKMQVDEPPTRDELEAVKALIDEADALFAFDGEWMMRNADAFVATRLLTGEYVRLPNGEVERRDRGFPEARSEAVLHADGPDGASNIVDFAETARRLRPDREMEREPLGKRAIDDSLTQIFESDVALDALLSRLCPTRLRQPFRDAGITKLAKPQFAHAVGGGLAKQ